MNKMPLIRDLTVAVFVAIVFFAIYPNIRLNLESKENPKNAIGFYYRCGNDTTKVIEVENGSVQTLDKKGNHNAFRVTDFFKRYEKLK